MNLSWKEVKFNKKNYILVEITLVLLIFMVIFLSGLTYGLEKAASGGLTEIIKSFFILQKDAEGTLSSSHLSQELVDRLKSEDGEGEAVNISRSFITTDSATGKLDIVYFGIDVDGKLMPEIIEGEGIEPGISDTIVLSERFKDSGIKLGDYITDNSEIELKVVGFTKDISHNYTSVGYVNYDTVMDIKSSVNPNYQMDYTVFATDKEIDLTTEKFGDLEEGKSDGIVELEVFTKQKLINKLPGYSAQQNTIIMITWVLVIVSASILGVFFYIITIQKQQQYGVMKALGMTNFEVSKVLLKQLLILSVLGVIIANLISFGISTTLPKSLPYLIKYDQIAIISVAFVLISLLSGLLSLSKISKVDPLTIIGGAK